MSLLVIPAARAADPSPQELSDGVQRRIREFRNVEFQYDVEATCWPTTRIEREARGSLWTMKPRSGPSQLVKTKEIFRILDPNRKDSVRPWRLWKQSIEENEQWVNSQQVIYDGRQASLFFRRDPGSRNDFHIGAIKAFEPSDYYGDNKLELFLSYDLNGVAEFNDPDWKLSRGMDNHWKVAGTVDFKGKVAHVLRGHNRFVDHLVHVIGAPHFLIVRHIMSPRDKPTSQPREKWEVASLGNWNGRLYAAGGTFVDSSDPLVPVSSYTFRVTGVKSLDDAARKDWRPEWPTGTAIGDRINNMNTMIPHAFGERDQIRARRSQRNLDSPLK